MSKRKLLVFIFTIIIILLNLLAFFRWDYTNIKDEMRYKTDLWTNKVWVEFYPPLADASSPMEFPVTNAPKFDSYDQLETYVKKIAISGLLVSNWVERMNLTNLYYGCNLFSILILIILIIRRKKIL
ncbi:hypothetical protein SK3146_04834 [Paenibacillus konkukensis]|uniref:Uncharacterized protein n=1 Tax=Paenibacillus konkukensis TaxID=2020716 RepID=A0ABY4RTL0_9BACL|nr:hypothetical protein SK3146_04834 [Paenibacillus konkukensis]